jgi:hypothetical protein
MPQRPRAIVYIDGFNLYRRALSGHPELKWLDLIKLSTNLLPEYEIAKVHYFTSLTKPFAFLDPGRATRHQIYLRALATLAPNLEITLGTFRSDARLMAKLPLELDPSGRNYTLVKVRKIEEKGSDVNLAIRLVSDAFRNLSDISIVLTNDSDQVGPLNLIQQELNQNIGIIFPVPNSRSSKSLMHTRPNLIRYLSYEILLASQLPSQLRDLKGLIQKPKEWGNSEGPISGAF